MVSCLILRCAGHQLTKQRLILLAQRCFLFHGSVSSLISDSVPDSPRGKTHFFTPKPLATVLIYRRLRGTLAAENLASMPWRT